MTQNIYYGSLDGKDTAIHKWVLSTPSSAIRNRKQALQRTNSIMQRVGEVDTMVRDLIFMQLCKKSRISV